ncbi:MAG: hypothetical protein KGL39_40940 [Patescibacteria group bacterium]|nr:hypothetical protein [Patescibacteria group bacterium]
MRIKMLSLSADARGVRQPGTIHEVSDKEGAELIKGGHAVAVKSVRSEDAGDHADKETADLPPKKK